MKDMEALKQRLGQVEAQIIVARALKSKALTLIEIAEGNLVSTGITSVTSELGFTLKVLIDLEIEKNELLKCISALTLINQADARVGKALAVEAQWKHDETESEMSYEQKNLTLKDILRKAQS